MKALTLAAALFVGAAVMPAAAQVVTISPTERNVVVQPFGITAGELETKAITDAQGNRLGDIQTVLSTGEGPSALVVRPENSQGRVIVPLERFNSANGVITVDITAAELAQLPAYTQ